VVLSSTEAEYIALSETAKEAMWLKTLFEEIGYDQKEPINILGDNNGSIAMTQNPQFHKRTKHVNIKWHWIRDQIQNNQITITKCSDPEQTADVLTKALPRPKFTKHRTELGLAPTV
jgi:hypothetical protein